MPRGVGTVELFRGLIAIAADSDETAAWR